MEIFIAEVKICQRKGSQDFKLTVKIPNVKINTIFYESSQIGNIKGVNYFIILISTVGGIEIVSGGNYSPTFNTVIKEPNLKVGDSIQVLLINDDGTFKDNISKFREKPRQSGIGGVVTVSSCY